MEAETPPAWLRSSRCPRCEAEIPPAAARAVPSDTHPTMEKSGFTQHKQNERDHGIMQLFKMQCNISFFFLQGPVLHSLT